MINLHFYNNKHIGIIGFGKTGKVAADAFWKAGANIELFDDTYISSDNKYAQCFKHYTHFDWQNMDALFVSPGIHLLWDHAHDAINMANFYGVKIINDIDLFQMHNYLCDLQKNLICISGTNGKSTTAALIYHIFSCANKSATIGGNFGIPILALDPDKQNYILELSSYQLESSNILMYDTAVLLNITPDHLVRHGGMIGYSAIKSKIFANFSEKSNAIIGVDDDDCCEIFDFLKYIKHPNIIPISGVSVPNGGIGWDGDYLIDKRINNTHYVVCEKTLLLDGAHNRQNIAATYAACICNDIDRDSFKNALYSFKGLEHRQEIVCDVDGVLYINDSKATNAESVEMALKRFDNIVWILGGRPKENGIEILLPYFKKIKYALLIGEATDLWADFLIKHNVCVIKCYTLKVAIQYSIDIIKKNTISIVSINKIDVVLLSPACASFDQFKSFEERGEHFKKIVHQIVKNKK